MPSRPHRPVAKGSNLIKVKAINLSVVLSQIRLRGPISRTELADLTELTSATITNVVNHLERLNLVTESGRVVSRGGGRNRVLLTLNNAAYRTVGVEISRHYVDAVLVDLAGHVVASAHEEFEQGEGPRQIISRVVRMVKGLIQESGTHPVVACGIGVPGPVNTADGVVISPPNFPGWRWLPLRDQVASQINLPVYIDDDAKTAALGESWFGAGRNVDSMVYLAVGTGIGAGVIVDGVLYRGTHELAGQIGHITLDVNGPRCECNNIGCLEVLASIPALVGTVRARLDAGEESELKWAHSNGALSIEAICEAVASADPLATDVMERGIQYLGAGLINLVNLYDPQMIVMGGRLVRLFDSLIPRLRRFVRERAYSFAAESVTIVPATLRARASAVGAATLALEQLFHDPAAFLERAKAE